MKLSAVLAYYAVELGNPKIANLQPLVFEGRATLDDMRARSFSAGVGALICWTGSRQAKSPGSDATDITFQFACYLSVPSKPSPAAPRKNVIADLTQAVIVRLHAADLPENEDLGHPDQVRAQNLYTIEDTKNGLSRSVVLWEATVRSKFDELAPDLPPFERIHHETFPEAPDTAPDPVITDQELEQP